MNVVFGFPQIQSNGYLMVADGREFAVTVIPVLVTMIAVSYADTGNPLRMVWVLPPTNPKGSFFDEIRQDWRFL